MNLERRSAIEEFEAALSNIDGAVFGDNDMCPLTHSFAPNMYVREIQIPAGMLVVGKIHKHEHPNFLLKGSVAVLTEDGGVQVLDAPCYMISPAGTKRALFTYSDTCWVTVHNNPDNITNTDELENQIIAKDYSDSVLTENQVKALEGLCLS